ncbi:MAG: lysophospholipid acyltransferase family protein [Frankia sp.]
MSEARIIPLSPKDGRGDGTARTPGRGRRGRGAAPAGAASGTADAAGAKPTVVTGGFGAATNRVDASVDDPSPRSSGRSDRSPGDASGTDGTDSAEVNGPRELGAAPRRGGRRRAADGPRRPAAAGADADPGDRRDAGDDPAHGGAERGAAEPEPTLVEELARVGSAERAVANMLAFVRRRITGDYTVDESGFDVDLTENLVAPLLRPIYRNYFRIETRGLEHIPDTGGALVVANHSGTLPIDAIMTSLAIMDHHPAQRHLRMLAADLVFSLPFLAPLARKTGQTLACQADAERLLGEGHLVGVWPEGFKGVGKPFSERYTLQRFGRGGFVSAALRTGVPIVPCSIVGAEEIYPMIGNAKTLARILGMPYLPITPTFPLLGLLGLVPLPSKWLIEFGEPVDTAALSPAAAEDPMLVFELTDQIRETIQQSLYGLLMERRSVFF